MLFQSLKVHLLHNGHFFLIERTFFSYRHSVLEKNGLDSLIPVQSLTKYPGNYLTDNEKRTLRAGKKATWLVILRPEE